MSVNYSHTVGPIQGVWVRLHIQDLQQRLNMAPLRIQHGSCTVARRGRGSPKHNLKKLLILYELNEIWVKSPRLIFLSVGSNLKAFGEA